MTISIRAAVDADAVRVAGIWRSGWRDAHLGRVPDALVRARTPATFVSRAQANIPDTLVAIVDETVAGFVVTVDDEIEQIYVSVEHRGSGVARELLAAGERAIAAAGFPGAWLAVVTGNERARRFYDHHGWTDEGDFIYDATVQNGQIDVPCRRYTKTFGAAARSSHRNTDMQSL